jgi:hypothetical protein
MHLLASNGPLTGTTIQLADGVTIAIWWPEPHAATAGARIAA